MLGADLVNQILGIGPEWDNLGCLPQYFPAITVCSHKAHIPNHEGADQYLVSWKKNIRLRPWSSMPVTENSSLLFSSCHLKLENNRLLSENGPLFVKITSKKSTIFKCIAACYFPKKQALDD